MTRHRELEAALARVGRDIEYPSTPDLAAAVRVELARGSAAPPASRWWDLRRAALAVAAACALIGALLTFSPATRDAVADFLGISGVEVRTEPGRPSSSVTARPPDIGLGEPVSLADARAAVDFEVRLPAGLGAPERVYFDGSVPGGKVSLVYEELSGARPLGDSDIKLVLSQFPGDLDRPYGEKVVHLGEGRVVGVTVGGAPGLFIRGGPHEIVYSTHEGVERVDTLRLAGNTLLWEADDVAYRLEADISRSGALRIAESLE